jgi:hypothetical protein
MTGKAFTFQESGTRICALLDRKQVAYYGFCGCIRSVALK